MTNRMLAWGLLMGLGLAVQGAASAPLTPAEQQRRSEVRQAVQAQRTPPATAPGSAGERRLSAQERAELREQIRQQGQGGQGPRERGLLR